MTVVVEVDSGEVMITGVVGLLVVCTVVTVVAVGENAVVLFSVVVSVGVVVVVVITCSKQANT